MKVFMRCLRILMLVSGFSIVTNCTKEGVVGPQGEEGVDGSTIYSGVTAPADDLGFMGDYYYRITTSDFYGPKSMEGWGSPTNLKGAVGADGAPGVPGPSGPTGADGSKIWNGNVIPGASTGKIGDYYFQSSTANFYGPKTSSGWGTPVNLKGAVGPKGEDGSTIISGVAIPDLSIGQAGDYYFRALTGDFYGPKTGTSWGTPTSLRGATGATGTAGSTILSGLVVPNTTLGKVGDYYFNKSNADFYGPKTGTSWGTPINLRGPAGPQGPPGTANVMYSNWETYPGGREVIIPAPITKDILDKGEVAVYVKEFKGEYLLGLYKIPYISNHIGDLVEFRLELNRIIVYSRSGSISATEDTQYRYVIIPGSIEIGSFQARVNLSDYKEVISVFNIPE